MHAMPNTGSEELRTNRAPKPEDVVLVVDDDPSIIETITSILRDVGYRAVGAASGAEALAFIKTTRPSLMLLDMRMPEMDGWTVAAKLHEEGSTIPIVVMTAAESARRWADEIGAASYLAKPFSLDQLLDLVNRYRRNPADS